LGQTEVVHEFIDMLGKSTPPVINADMVINYIKNIVVDSDSLEEFIVETDRYLKHSQTFQMGFMLHSLASVLTVTSHGNPIRQVQDSIATNAFNISLEEGMVIKALPEAKRYDEICEPLMDPTTDFAIRLNDRIVEGRNSGQEKIDDGSEANQIFDPMKLNFPTQDEPGQDMTEELEIKD